MLTSWEEPAREDQCQNWGTHIVHSALSLPGVVQRSLEHSGGHSAKSYKTNILNNLDNDRIVNEKF